MTIPLHFLEQPHVTNCNFEDFVYAFEEIKIVRELTDVEIFSSTSDMHLGKDKKDKKTILMIKKSTIGVIDKYAVFGYDFLITVMAMLAKNMLGCFKEIKVCE